MAVDDTLNDFDRAQWLMRRGQAIQKLGVLGSIHSAYVPGNSSSLKQLISLVNVRCSAWRLLFASCTLHVLTPFVGLVQPVVCSEAQPDDQRIAACASLRKVVEDHHTSFDAATIETVLMPMLMKCLNKAKLPAVLHHVCDTILVVVDDLPSAYVRNTLLPAAEGFGSVSQCSGRREVCCRLLGAVASRRVLSPEQVVKTFFEQAMGLCQDTEATVRAHMARQLAAIAAAVGASAVDDTLVDELLELLKDESADVRMCGGGSACVHGR